MVRSYQLLVPCIICQLFRFRLRRYQERMTHEPLLANPGKLIQNFSEISVFWDVTETDFLKTQLSKFSELFGFCKKRAQKSQIED